MFIKMQGRALLKSHRLRSKLLVVELKTQFTVSMTSLEYQIHWKVK